MGSNMPQKSVKILISSVEMDVAPPVLLRMTMSVLAEPQLPMIPVPPAEEASPPTQVKILV